MQKQRLVMECSNLRSDALNWHVAAAAAAAAAAHNQPPEVLKEGRMSPAMDIYGEQAS
jgi:hypothetical protein